MRFKKTDLSLLVSSYVPYDTFIYVDNKIKQKPIKYTLDYKSIKYVKYHKFPSIVCLLVAPIAYSSQTRFKKTSNCISNKTRLKIVLNIFFFSRIFFEVL